MPTIPPKKMKELIMQIYSSMQVPPKTAAFVADLLTRSSVAGHDSHGIIYVTRYAERIKMGLIVPQAKPVVVRNTRSTAVIDGRWAFGQLTAKKAMEVAIKKARTCGISAVSAFRCNHVGRLGAYTEIAASQNMIGIMFANVPHRVVQAYGGTRRILGTNPMSFAIPTGKKDTPFLLDFATSNVAEGKVTLAAMKGESIPIGWIVDAHGNQTNNPDDLYPGGNSDESEQGRLLPFGSRDGHKGFALSLLMDVIGGILTGSGSSIGLEKTRNTQNGLYTIAINITHFTKLALFKRRLDVTIDGMKSSPVDPSFKIDHITIPGEPERVMRQKRLKEGIDVPAPIWRDISNLALDLGLDPEEVVSR